MLSDIAHGHTNLADWLFLAAAVVLVVAALIATTSAARPDRTAAALIPAGLALLALGWLVL